MTSPRVSPLAIPQYREIFFKHGEILCQREIFLEIFPWREIFLEIFPWREIFREILI